MGLDMYAFSCKAEDFGVDKPSERATEIAYWRKFNALHGWMEDLWRSQNPEDERSFNCIDLHLTSADLLQLSEDIGNNALKPREGFFFGNQEIYPEHIESTVKFITDAFEAIEAGRVVFYTSWW